ncbi:acyl-CoA dehydrogenase [candidate division KSB1 bacterium 4484_219]|nr:MAG: acyl-CoA dehydrogenase [candidate division KSB1 bacterium 4484_219]
MDYFLTEQQQMLKELAHKVAEEKVRPVAAKYDESHEFPWDIVKIFADLGFFGVYIPEEYGGLGGGVMDLVITVEELSRACGGIALAVAATALGAYPILMAGNDEQKKRYLPDLAEGKYLAGYCLTEPEAGSDAGAVRTRAVRDGDYYILNGTKHFITNGSVAKLYTVFASTDPSRGIRGISAFLVEDGFPGLSYGKLEDKLGIRASATSEILFQDCRVPKENLLGKEGQGFRIAMETFDRTRPGVAAQAVGIAQGALELALEYTKQRRQFGQTIASFEAIQFMLADMATQVEAARALVYQTARMIDSGAKDISRESAMCKLFASDTAMKVTTDAVQLFGGYGYMRDYPIEKYFRDAKITQIYEGTNQIQRLVIGRHLIKRGF